MKNYLQVLFRLMNITSPKLQQGILAFLGTTLIVGWFVCLFKFPTVVLPIMLGLMALILIAVVAKMAWIMAGNYLK